MNALKPYLLVLITFLPAIAAVALIAYHKATAASEAAQRYFALGASALTFLLSLPLAIWHSDPALSVEVPWIPTLGVRFHLGVDGLSVWLVLLATLLTPLALLADWKSVHYRLREYLACMLLLETGVIGVFLSLDMILFYLFWEVVLIPMYFLIGVWGGEKRAAAAVKFFIYTVVGGLLMLAAMIGAYFLHGKATGLYAFDLPQVAQILAATRAYLPLDVQMWLFLGFAVAFFIKMPLFPLHTWQADAYGESPTGAVVIMAALMSKMGAYGILRFALPMFPDAANRCAPVILTLSVIGIIYGALIALAQTDMKRLLAYSSLSHLGFVTLGIFSFNDSGMEGAVFQMVAHGVTAAALFLLVGMLERRRKSVTISEFGGVATPMPRFSVLLVVVALASAGLPLTNGFVGEFLTLLGAFTSRHSVAFASVAAVGVILSAAYLLRLVQRVIFGQVTDARIEALSDADAREMASLAPLIALIFVMGVAPNLFLKPSRAAVDEIRKPVSRPTQGAPRAAASPAPVQNFRRDAVQ
jgi:NADH-quinone oxidoreductase subunit M